MSNHENQNSGAEGLSDLEGVVILPPYVKPEHRQLIEKTEEALEEYSAHLLEKPKTELFEHGFNIEPHQADIEKAERRFHEDPMRQHLIKQLVHLKVLCENPRFLIKAT
jgi:hypothetical protein